MQILKQEIFEYDGKTFIIIVDKTNDGYAAAAYDEKGLQVTCLHIVDVEHSINISFFRRYGESYAFLLVDDVKKDISMGRYLKDVGI